MRASTKVSVAVAVRKLIAASALATFILGGTVQRAQAADRFSATGLAPYIVLVGGQALDAESTIYALHAGCSESNRFAGPNPSTARIIATKAATVAGIALAMHFVHGRAAKVLGYIGGGIGAGAGLYNLHQKCQ